MRAGHKGRSERGVRLECTNEALDGGTELFGLFRDRLGHEEHGPELPPGRGELEHAALFDPRISWRPGTGLPESPARITNPVVALEVTHFAPERLPGPRGCLVHHLMAQLADVALGMVREQDLLGPRQH